ncbi:MAG: hypothetical protein CMM96_05880 [Rickettsiales bacterium]|nr:hypothetical protein [Rickettsiales bacterium]
MIFKNAKHQVNRKAKIILIIFGSIVFFFVGVFFQRFGLYGEKIAPYFAQMKRELKTNSTNNKLENISIDIPFINYNTIEEKRLEALRISKLINNDEYVSAHATYKGKKVKIKIRLKGDYIDHLSGDKWSFRVRVNSDETIMGMKQFSLHHPSQRLYLNEWLYHKIMKKEDIISLRYEFVNLRVNGKVLGIYALEEHFDKRLLEHNKRKESIIIRFDENRMWEEFIQFRPYRDRKIPGYGGFYSSDIDAFQSGNIRSDYQLKLQFLKAAKLLSDFRSNSKKTSEVFDIDRLSKFFALSDILGSEHGARWHNARFYFNPFTNVLEPISFDGNPNYTKSVICNTSSGYHSYYQKFFDDVEFYKKYLQYLSKYSDQSFGNQIINDYQEELSSLEDIIRSEWEDYNFSFDFITSNSNYIRTLLSPNRIVDVNIIAKDNKNLKLSIGNLQFFPITNLHLFLPDSTVIYLPESLIISGKNNEEHLSYEKLHFSISDDLKILENDKLHIGFNFIGLNEVKYEPILGYDYTFYEVPSDVKKEAPNYHKFNFIYEEVNSGKIFFKIGNHKLKGPIIFPPNKMIYINEGTTLDMSLNSYIYSKSPFTMKGTVDNPIKFYSSDTSAGGILIDRPETESFFENVQFYNLGQNVQENLGITGAVTIYESKASIKNCKFYNNFSEDALNVVRSTFNISNTSFSNNLRDALDVDYCNGEINNSFFSFSGNDAIDISGSKINLNQIEIHYANDKGISVGESSNLNAKNIKIHNSNIGVASKDLSNVQIQDLEIKTSEIGLAVFQKKPEFGPAKLNITNGTLFSCNVEYLLENKSTLTLNNKNLKDTIIDVSSLIY